jgi:hypothetical protein
MNLFLFSCGEFPSVIGTFLTFFREDFPVREFSRVPPAAPSTPSNRKIFSKKETL